MFGLFKLCFSWHWLWLPSTKSSESNITSRALHFNSRYKSAMNKLNKSGESLSPCATPDFCSISFDKNSPSRICWKLHLSTDCIVCSMFPWSPLFYQFCKQQVPIYESFFVVNEAGIVFAVAADVMLDCFFQVRNCVDFWQFASETILTWYYLETILSCSYYLVHASETILSCSCYNKVMLVDLVLKFSN